MVTCVSDIQLNILLHTFKKNQHNQCLPFSINKFKRHWHIIIILAHANLSLSTKKAGLLEINYSVLEDGKAKK